MPKKDKHLSKAADNEKFALSLNLSPAVNVDWAVTALFYAAVHYVEAYLAQKNLHSTDHRARDSSIQRDKDLKALYNEYVDLKNQSVNARYYMRPIPASEVSVLANSLKKIQSHLSPYF